MNISFTKYQGTGNDFIMLDNRNHLYSDLTTEQIKYICDRRFGIGGDGLILLENIEEVDFKMVYYNADGNESTMCGNGGRCITMFAHQLHVIQNITTFLAIDGKHQASVLKDEIKLQMNNVLQVKVIDKNYELNTGSPHYVSFVEQVQSFPVFDKGKEIRNNDTYIKEGINVNFVEVLSTNHIYVRTYERGVEDETLSCGTGCTAAAISYHKKYIHQEGNHCIYITTPGGNLQVHFFANETGYTDVWLEGKATKVFEGTIII